MKRELKGFKVSEKEIASESNRDLPDEEGTERVRRVVRLISGRQ